MEVKKNRLILIILLFCSLVAINSPIHAMEILSSNDSQEQVITNLKLTSFFIDKIIKSLQDKMIQLIPDQYAQAVHDYYYTYTCQKYKRQVKLGIAGKESILKFCNNDPEVLKGHLINWFDELLDQKQITSTKFIKSFNRECSNSSFNIIDNLDKEESQIILKNDKYTLAELSNIIVPFILKRADLEMEINEFIKFVKLIILEIFIQTYSLSDEHKKLTICTCPKVYLGERILAIIMVVNKFYRSCNKLNTENNPLIYTNLGSGDLLQDYLAIKLLNDLGFKHFRFNFIDKHYKYEEYTSKLKTCLIEQLNKLSIDTFSVDFYKNISKFLNHNSDGLITSDIIISIDTSELNEVREKKAEEQATSALVTFTNKTHNITQNFNINLESNYMSQLYTRMQDLYSGYKHSETNEMKEQTNLFQRKVQQQILDKTGRSKPNIIKLLKVARDAFNIKIKDCPGYQNNGYRNIEIIWKRNPEADFRELVSQTRNQNSIVCSLNNHKLKIV